MPKKVSHTPSSPSPSWNNGEYFKVVKLRTGEVLLCMMDQDSKSVAVEPYLTLIRPAQAVMISGDKARVQTEDGTSVIATDYKLKEWIDVSSTKEFVIDTSMVITMGDMSARLKFQYQEYCKLMDDAEKAFNEQTDALQKENAIATLLLGLSPNGGYDIVENYKDGKILTEVEDDEEAATLRDQQRFFRSISESRNLREASEAEEGGVSPS